MMISSVSKLINNAPPADGKSGGILIQPLRSRRMPGVMLVIGAVAMMQGASGRAVGDRAENDGPLPETPTAFETRYTGKQSESVASLRKVNLKKRQVTVTAVTQSREWKDGSGKVVKARLVAFAPAKGEPEALIREGHIRLLLDGAQRLSLVPFAKMSAEDQVYIRGLVAARREATEAQKRRK